MSLFRGEEPILGSSEVVASFAGDDSLTITALAGQTGSLLNLKNSSGTSIWTVSAAGAQVAASGQHLLLNTTSDDKQVRINSRSFTQATGDSIGFQSKPSQTVTTTGSVFGGQISPRLQSGVAAGNIIGLDVNSDLKGTAAGTVSGDVRALNLELVTDDSGTRTVSGNVNAIRIRSVFSATTISGKFVPIRIEKAEAQTNSKQYDAILELPSTVAGVWNDAPGTEPTTADGYIKVLVNGAARYIQLYSGAPVD